MTAISLQNIIRDVPGSDRPLLDGVSLKIGRGELVNLVGPSGSGKSTLLRLLNRLDEASHGEINILGRALGDWPVRELRRKVAFVFQEPVMIGATVRDALCVPYLVWGEESPAQGNDPFAQALQNVGLAPKFLAKRCADLSVGERQRVSIARALLTDPEVILLDEPTSGLDEQTAQELLAYLAGLNQTQNTTILIANHRTAEVRFLAGRMVVLQEGSVVADGGVEEIFDHPPSPAVRSFLQGYANSAGKRAVAPGEGS